MIRDNNLDSFKDLDDFNKKYSVPGGGLIMKAIGLLMGIVAIIFIIKWIGESIFGLFDPTQIVKSVGNFISKGVKTITSPFKHFPNVLDDVFPVEHLTDPITNLFSKAAPNAFDKFSVGETSYNFTKNSMLNMTSFFRNQVDNAQTINIDGVTKKLEWQHLSHIKEHPTKSISDRVKDLKDAFDKAPSLGNF